MKGEIFSCFNLCPCEAVGCGQSHPHGRSRNAAWWQAPLRGGVYKYPPHAI